MAASKSLRTFRIILWTLVAVVAIGATALYFLRPPARPLGVTGQEFALNSTKGGAFTQDNLSGTPSLVFFGYTYCPDVCPTTLAVMEQALEKLGPAAAARVTPVFVTIDPARDTPQVLKPYLKSFGPRFVGLTGSKAAITLISHEYSVYAAKQPIKGGGYAMNHSSTIYLMGPNGKFVTHYEESIGPDGLAADLRKQI